MKDRKKPAIRFKGFTEDWEHRKLSELCFLVTKGTTPLDKSSIGTVNFVKIESIDEVSGEIKIMQKITDEEHNGYLRRSQLKKGDILFSIAGTLGRVTAVKSGILPANTNQALAIIRLKSGCLQYIKTYLKGKAVADFIKENPTIGAQPNLSLEQVGNLEISLPTENEQKFIGAYFQHLNNLITLHQRKYDKLVNVKKSMLEKIFPKNGESIPDIRFSGFTEDWEQRKFADVVQIERGGSPRPIDAYTTDSSSGLNWVKIGDAPTQGHYITKTVEKIKPEGLSKTREVHPGDLILSNSMSFGKPYIMGIDGWLLIRNINNTFDLTFLCHLLGTPQMLGQYKSLAAGSTVNNLNKELVGNTVVTIPEIDEQRVLGQYLERLDHLITLHQRKLEKLKNIKKSCLEKMFI